MLIVVQYGKAVHKQHTEPYSSEAAAGAQPNMPAMAQGPLEEPPGPVSPGWWPARKAATVSSCT